jgi:DNA polymerase
MNPQEELRELIRQAAEHLHYFREMGLTHIGEQTPPAQTETEAPGEAAVQSAAAQSDEKLTEVSSAPAFENPAPAAIPIPEPVKTMSRKPSEPPASSLFGDELLADNAAPEEKYADETLEDIRADLGECQRCKLWRTRTNIVFGEGNPKAELMFVGEAPGADEDATGRPFVGRAGQLLTKMIEAIGMKREEVYIGNILKSRPPGNRNPEADETAACKPFLLRQIAVIRPKLIVTLGNPATQGLLETKVGITKLRGEFQNYPRIAGIKVLPTFHPAFLLRSPDKKREAWEDLKKVRAFLKGEIQR